MQGILLVDKPAGWTSFDVVNFVRKNVAQLENKKPKEIKVGHAGTLDPFATGLLIVLVGKQLTKEADRYLKLDKAYSFSIKLGYDSTTGDPEGEIRRESGIKPTVKAVEKAIAQFSGEMQQIPPAYSAIKIGGKKSYELARKGQAVAHSPRPVNIRKISLINYDYPEIELEAEVSSGTYIRVLSEDIAKALGTGGYTSALRRTKIGKYQVNQATGVSELKPDKLASMLT